MLGQLVSRLTGSWLPPLNWVTESGLRSSGHNLHQVGIVVPHVFSEGVRNWILRFRSILTSMTHHNSGMR